MPTWGEVQNYVRSKYKLAQDHDEHFSMDWAYDNGRLQRINVRRFTAFNEEWIEWTSAACKKGEMHPEVALRKNGNFAVGALFLGGPPGDELYIFRYSVPLDTMDLEEFELPLHVVASTADQIEAEFSAGDQF